MLQVFPKSIGKLFELVPFFLMLFFNWYCDFAVASISVLLNPFFASYMFIYESLKKLLNDVCNNDCKNLREDSRGRCGSLIFFFVSHKIKKEII
jgi:hypothetical protein